MRVPPAHGVLEGGCPDEWREARGRRLLIDRRFAILKEVLLRAIELPEDRRPAWIGAACAGDEALRAEVESKLSRLDGELRVKLGGRRWNRPS